MTPVTLERPFDPARRTGRRVAGRSGTRGVRFAVDCLSRSADDVAGSKDREGTRVSFEVVSAYTLLVGDADEPATVSVHSTADDAWRALDREVRRRCGMRPRPRRRIDSEAATRLANAWRAGDPDSRYWNLTVHRLPIPLPVIAREAMIAGR
jgi:hypothetical protein